MAGRPARLRKKGISTLVRETSLHAHDLICPLFVDENLRAPVPIPSLPGFSRHTVETAMLEAEEVTELGIPAIIVFGVPRHKNHTGSSALSGIGTKYHTRDKGGRVKSHDYRRHLPV